MKVSRIAGEIRRRFSPKGIRQAVNTMRFLRPLHGVIHVGAHVGEERRVYSLFGLNVLWVEPIPDFFAELEQNIARFPRHRACRYLVTDRDNDTHTMNISSNAGMSSSILDLASHRTVYPHVTYSGSQDMRSTTLASLVEKESVDVSRYDGLVLDTQGTELLVLKGAGDLLSRFRRLRIEAADFELYANCCRVADIEEYVRRYGFREYARTPYSKCAEGGCYDIFYEKRPS